MTFWPTAEEAKGIVERRRDPDAFPDHSEDSIAKEWDYASAAITSAYAEGKLVMKGDK